MRTVEKNVYEFSELSEKAKKKVLNNFSDINVDYDWWDGVYEDAAQIGLKITGFDLNYRTEVTGELTESVETIVNLILENHGKDCGTHKLAKSYVPRLVTAALIGAPDDVIDDGREEFEEEFKKDLLNEYGNILRNDYEYQISDEAIIETIEANDYEFYEDGTQYR